ncbi:unnamed protein product [Discosporangium mesarthrocarpum]
MAGEDGTVRFYDFKFRIEAWFEDLNAGPVTSVSFANGLEAKEASEGQAFHVPDFTVGTRRAYIVTCSASAFQQLDPERR